MARRSPILPGARYRVTLITRRDGRRWPYQLKIRDRATGRETREAAEAAAKAEGQA